MTYAETVRKYTEKYGSTVEFSPDGKVYTASYKAFIQPLRYKNKMYLDGKHSEIGFIDNSYYLYLGPPEIDLCNNTIYSRIKIGDLLYSITHAEMLSFAEENLYVWAIIRRSFTVGTTDN